MVAAVTTQDFEAYIKKPWAEADQALVQLVVDAATGVAEGVVGGRPIVQRSVTSRVPGGDFLYLPVTPVTSIETVAGVYPDGNTWAPEDFVIDDAEIGAVSLLLGRPMPYTVAGRRQKYDVTYTAGLFATEPDVDENVRLAVLIIAQQLWRTRYGRAARPGVLGERDSSVVDDVAASGSGFAIPNRAVELLRPYGPGAVFA